MANAGSLSGELATDSDVQALLDSPESGVFALACVRGPFGEIPFDFPGNAPLLLVNLTDAPLSDPWLGVDPMNADSEFLNPLPGTDAFDPTQ